MSCDTPRGATSATPTRPVHPRKSAPLPPRAAVSAEDAAPLARPERHSHLPALTRAADQLLLLREQLLIPPHWSICLQILCPEQYHYAQGSIGWRYWVNGSFVLRLRCDLTEDELRWIIAHELLEAQLGRYAEFTERFIESAGPQKVQLLLHRQHAQLRDEFIEWTLRVMLNGPRPDRWDTWIGRRIE